MLASAVNVAGAAGGETRDHRRGSVRSSQVVLAEAEEEEEEEGELEKAKEGATAAELGQTSRPGPVAVLVDRTCADAAHLVVKLPSVSRRSALD